MELLYSPLACSLAAHVVCIEASLPITLRRVDLEKEKVEGGGGLTDWNPMRQVPTLVREGGSVLTENAAVLLYLADLRPATRLAPAAGSEERYAVIRWLSFVGSELHKGVNSPVFGRHRTPEVAAHARSRAAEPLAVVERELAERKTLVGDAFTVADAYLFWALYVMPFGGVPLDAFPALGEYVTRHATRSSVVAALDVERRLYGQPLPDVA